MVIKETPVRSGLYAHTQVTVVRYCKIRMSSICYKHLVTLWRTINILKYIKE